MSETKGFEIKSAHMRPPRWKQDKSTVLAFETGEMTTDEQVLLLTSSGQLGTLIFVPEGVQSPPEKMNAEHEGKTPSQRLRGVLYVFWKQQGEEGDFNTFYASQMNKFIDAVKEKLDD